MSQKLSRFYQVPINDTNLSRQNKTVQMIMQKPLRILIDKYAVRLNDNTFDVMFRPLMSGCYRLGFAPSA
jgi:hypothetical protein